MTLERGFNESLNSPKLLPFTVIREKSIAPVEKVLATYWFRKQAENFLKQGKRWQSPKAKVNEFLKIVPEERRLLQIIVPADDEAALREIMLKHSTHQYPELREKSWVGLRTCFKEDPLNKPWTMGKRTRKQVEDFFQPQNQAPTSWQGSREHYPEWRQNPDLTEIIVMVNYPRLGLPEYDEEFFVFRVFLYYPHGFFPEARMAVALMPNTSQLRDLDRGTRKTSTIYIEPRETNYQPLARKQELMISFGANYLQQGQVKPEAEALAKRVGKTVFDEWCQPPNLYSCLIALEEIGLEALEFQGVKEGSQIKSMRLYGLRGVKEYTPT